MKTTAVDCPVCKRAAGQKCVTTGRTGKQKTRKAHTGRVNFAKKGTP